MRKLIMYIGLPNSGKSTHAETFAKEHNYVIVKTNEELLRELDKEESRVIFDNYNNVRSNRIKLIELLKDKFEDLLSRTIRNNIRLASKLTKWKIEIKSLAQINEEGNK